MNSQSIVAGAIGLLIVAGVVGGTLFYTHQNRLFLEGEIFKVRTHQTDPEHTIAVIDFRVRNPSKSRFVVRQVDVSAVLADGKDVEAMTIAELDAQRVFKYYPVLGPKYNPTLLIRDRIQPGETLDRMVAVQFPAAEPDVVGRKKLRLTIEDVDGAKAVIEK